MELLKNVVMNPYSHPSAPNIPKQEVTDAIAAVTAFLDLVAKKMKPQSDSKVLSYQTDDGATHVEVRMAGEIV